MFLDMPEPCADCAGREARSRALSPEFVRVRDPAHPPYGHECRVTDGAIRFFDARS